MAKNIPAFQFYPSDFLCGTATMTATEVGIYIRILCHLWVAGNRLPDDDDRIAVLAACSRETFDECWPVVRAKLQAIGGDLMHPRMEQMIEIREKRKKAGSKGGKQTAKQTRKQTTQQTHQQNGKQTSSTKSGSAGTDDWVLPEGWDTEEVRSALDEWVAMRKKIRKPLPSKAGASKGFKYYDGPDHLIYACEFAIQNGYQGIKPDYRPPRRSGSAASVGQQMLGSTF